MHPNTVSLQKPSCQGGIVVQLGNPNAAASYICRHQQTGRRLPSAICGALSRSGSKPGTAPLGLSSRVICDATRSGAAPNAPQAAITVGTREVQTAAAAGLTLARRAFLGARPKPSPTTTTHCWQASGVARDGVDAPNAGLCRVGWAGVLQARPAVGQVRAAKPCRNTTTTSSSSTSERENVAGGLA